MLQNTKARSDIGPDLLAVEPSPGSEFLQRSVGFMRRQFPIICFVAILAIALAFLYVTTARPVFSAQAQLLVDAQKLQVFQRQSVLGDLPVDSAQVESQVEILKSENIASAVIKKLNLTENPEFGGGAGGVLGRLLNSVSDVLGLDHPRSEFELERTAVRNFQDRLSVKRVGLTYVIQIDFKSYDPDLAAQVANAVADSYIDDQLDSKYQATKRASTWLQERIKELRDQVASAEQAVVDFTTKNNIVNTGGAENRPLAGAQVAELSSQLVIARANTAETKARLDRINSILQQGAIDSSFNATVADTLKNEIVSKLRAQYLELAAREADWSTKYGSNHIAVVNLRNQMQEIRNSILEELKRLGETYKSDYAIAKQREAGVQEELSRAVAQSQAIDEKSVTLRQLQSTAQTYKSLYDDFLQRYMESVQQQSFPISEARLISPASRPLQKSEPKTGLVLLIAGLGGLILGVALGLLRDLGDRVFRTSDQVENILQADCIALVPFVPSDGTDRALSEGKGNTNRAEPLVGSGLRKIAQALGSLTLVADVRGSVRSAKTKVRKFTSSNLDAARPALAAREPRDPASDIRHIVWTGAARAVIDEPFSRFAEAMRSIKLACDLSVALKPGRVIGFTSSLPNEGKSTIAASLAQLSAKVGARVILVDCDLRNPSLSRMLAPGASTGLLHVVSGKSELQPAIWTDPATKLSFLPAVSSYRLAHSNEILSSAFVKKLFDKLRTEFDWVIVDLPPLAPIVDVRATANLIDSYIYVVEWGRTKIDLVEHALSRAPNVYDNLLGVVLNKVDMNIFSRFTSDHQRYYYNEGYSQYGYTE